MPCSDIVITAAKRTPVGSFLGAFAATPAHELGRVAIEAALAQAGVAGEDVSEVILGQVLTAAQGQNPRARRRWRRASRRKCRPGASTRCAARACARLRFGGTGGRDRRCDDRRRGRPGIHVDERARADAARSGQKMGDLSLIDTMVKDGLTDAFNRYHMGITAENLAEQYQITRDAQDAFSVRSQNLADAARSSGRFRDEIAAVTITGRKGDTIVADDEYIRAGVTIESVSGVRPAFKKDGTVTAANASGLNDGAAALVVMTRAEAERRGSPILARIASWASAGRRSVDHGHRPGPRHAPRAGKGRLEHRRPRPDRSERGLSPRRHCRSARNSAGMQSASTSMAARSRSATRSARAGRVC